MACCWMHVCVCVFSQAKEESKKSNPFSYAPETLFRRYSKISQSVLTVKDWPPMDGLSDVEFELLAETVRLL